VTVKAPLIQVKLVCTLHSCHTAYCRLNWVPTIIFSKLLEQNF